MPEQVDDPPSPTVAKILSEYATALKQDGRVDDMAIARLTKLLSSNKTIKPNQIDEALYQKNDGAKHDKN